MRKIYLCIVIIALLIYCLYFFLSKDSYNLKNLDEIKFCGSIKSGLKNPEGVIKLRLTYSDTLKNINKIINFKNLRYLEINDKNLDSIPDVVFKLRKLQVLVLNRNKIQSISKDIKSLENLRRLELAWNNFQSLSNEIYSLRKIEILNLKCNNLVRVTDDILNLKNLKCLNIAFNKDLNYDELFFLLSKLPKFEELTLGVKDFNRLPESIKLINNLRSITLGGRIGDFDLKHSLQLLSEIQNLQDITLPYFIDELPKEIGLLKNLIKLYVNQSNIKEIPIEIGNLKKLKVLEIYPAKYIKVLPDEFYMLTELQKAQLMWCSITELKEDICKLKNLKYFNIHGANLSELPECFGKLRNLEELHLGYNKFNKLPSDISNWKSLKKLNLRDVDLADNEKKRIENVLNKTEIKFK